MNWPILLFSAILSAKVFAETTGPHDNGHDFRRLPTEVKPYHYSVTFFPVFVDDYPSKVIGNVSIYFYVQNATNVIFLHAHQNVLINGNPKIFNVFYPDSPSRVSVINLKKHFTNEVLEVSLSSALTVDNSYVLQISYQHKFTDLLNGIYRSSYEEDSKKKAMILTQMEPGYARKAFPCFDEPALKATFNISIIRDQKYHSISNTKLLKTIKLKNGYFKDIFKTTPKMPTYLVAFSVTKFLPSRKVSQHGDQNIDYAIWTRKASTNYTKYALKISPMIIEYFNEYFGVAYPLQKIDQVAALDFSAGAMENWGLIMYREKYLLYNPQKSSLFDKYVIAGIITHELSHQWFGNLVTMKWWDDIWLNEGFASYLEYIGIQAIEPKWNIMDFFTTIETHSVFQRDSLTSSHPIYLPITDVKLIIEVFDSISYTKGSAVIRMMHNFIGDAAFKAGLQTYIKDLSYSNADHGMLWSHLQAKTNSSINIKRIMDTWILQMGYPLVKISRKGLTNQFVAEQEYYKQDPSAELSKLYISPFNYTWYVPLTCTSQSHPNWENPEIIWMNRSSAEFTMELPVNDWIICNVKQVGYYRVTYGKDIWKSILQQLNTNFEKIHFLNRAQLIDDMFNLAKSSHISYTLAFDLSQYIQREFAYQPLAAAYKSLYRISRRMAYFNKTYPLFSMYIRKLIEPVYRKVGWKSEKSESLGKTFLQSLILKISCAFSLESCLEEAKQKFSDYKKGFQEIAPTMKSVILCTGIRFGDYDDWLFVYNKLNNTEDFNELSALRKSLSCSQNATTLKQFLDIIMDENLTRSQDVSSMLHSVAKSKVGQETILHFLNSNFKDAKYRLGNDIKALNKIARLVTVQKVNLDEVNAFAEKFPEIKKAASWKNGVDTIKANKAWLEEKVEEFVSVLKQKLTIL